MSFNPMIPANVTLYSQRMKGTNTQHVKQLFLRHYRNGSEKDVNLNIRMYIAPRTAAEREQNKAALALANEMRVKEQANVYREFRDKIEKQQLVFIG